PRSPRRAGSCLRHCLLSLLGEQLLDAVDYVTHAAQVLHLFVRHADPEFVLDCEDDVDTVERVDLHLLEGGVDGERIRRDALGFGDDSEDSSGYVFGNGGHERAKNLRKRIAYLSKNDHGSPMAQLLFSGKARL